MQCFPEFLRIVEGSRLPCPFDTLSFVIDGFHKHFFRVGKKEEIRLLSRGNGAEERKMITLRCIDGCHLVRFSHRKTERNGFLYGVIDVSLSKYRVDRLVVGTEREASAVDFLRENAFNQSVQVSCDGAFLDVDMHAGMDFI